MKVTRYRARARTLIRSQPHHFATGLGWLQKGRVFNGQAYGDPAWVSRVLGGFVARDRLEVVDQEETMQPAMEQQVGTSQERYLAAIDRFSNAITAIAKRVPKAERDELRDATGDLLEAVASRATEQSLAGFSLLLDKLEALEGQVGHLLAPTEQAQELGG